MSEPTPTPEIRQNLDQNRFELSADGSTAVLEYSLENDTIILRDTRVPPELGGRGIGGLLARAGLEYARENGLKVVVLCSFVTAYIQKHPEYQSLLKK